LVPPERSDEWMRARRLEAYVRPHLLCIDEVGYLSYDVRHADLLFEVVTRRHEKKRSIVLTTNKAFAEWPTTFPNAACVVALVDRLINRADVVVIDGESYRLHEAEERQRSRRPLARREGIVPPGDRYAAPADDRLNASAGDAGPGDRGATTSSRCRRAPGSA